MLSMAIDPRVNEAKHRHGWVHIDVCTVKSHLILDANTQCGEQSRSASQPGAAGRRGNDNLVQRLLDPASKSLGVSLDRPAQGIE